MSVLETPGALLTRTQLRELGLERRAVDAVFRALPTVRLPGYSRPMVKATDYLGLLELCTSDETCAPTEASRVLIAPAKLRPPDFRKRGTYEGETDE